MISVAIIDDNPIVLSSLAQTVPWEKAGCTLCGTATDGEAGYAFILTHRPEIVLADIKMPGLSGLSLIDRLRQEMASPPLFIIITSYTVFQYAKTAISLGVFSYLTKPIDNDELVETLQKAVRHLVHGKAWEELLTPDTGPALIPSAVPANTCTEPHELPLPQHTTLSPLVRKALSYMYEHMAERLSLSDVADAVCLSPNYISSLIRKETGQRFLDLLLTMKIERAKTLLRDPSVKVYEAGMRVGYEEYSYFYQAFRKATGLSPKEYRASAE